MPEIETLPSLLVSFNVKPSIIAMRDPLLDLINAYRLGLADFNQNAPEDDPGASLYADLTYLAPMRALMAWAAPAATKDGALSALRLAVDATFNREKLLAAPMIQAALWYFEKTAFE